MKRERYLIRAINLDSNEIGLVIAHRKASLMEIAHSESVSINRVALFLVSCHFELPS